MFRIFNSIYRVVKSCVKTCTGNTQYFDCPVGVRQGCMLSPFPFSFFINELPNESCKSGQRGVQFAPDLNKLLCSLFTDDVVLFSYTIIDLQRLLNGLGDYCKEWKMSVNMKKPKNIVFKDAVYLCLHLFTKICFFIILNSAHSSPHSVKISVVSHKWNIDKIEPESQKFH